VPASAGLDNPIDHAALHPRPLGRPDRRGRFPHRRLLLPEVIEWLRAHPPEAARENVIALVAFPDQTLLDPVGPLQVLKGLPAPYRTVVVGERVEALATDSGLAITPERTFADVPRPFAIVVPGGPGSVAAMADPAGSVCTGALVLGAAGLLEGRRATTH
jgi:transcriptional regulator GlxA family with amidase domain